jgi:aspartate 1-decarboxylase
MDAERGSELVSLAAAAARVLLAGDVPLTCCGGS